MSSTPDITYTQAKVDAGKLCQACGLCCSGVLFSYVGLTNYEASALEGSLVGPIIHNGKKAVFGLPCSALEGTKCSIYDKRPSVCRTYHCHLTRRVSQSEIGLTEALSLVEGMKVEADWLIKNTPEDVRLRRSPPGEDKTSDALMAIAKQPRGLWLILSKMADLLAQKKETGGPTGADTEYAERALSFVEKSHELFEASDLKKKYRALNLGS